MPIPSAMALEGSRTLTGLPSTSTSPESGDTSPYRMFISVVFPAPFSPSSAWISPARTSKLMSSFARTPGKRFVMPRISSAGGGSLMATKRVGGPATAGPPSRSLGSLQRVERSRLHIRERLVDLRLESGGRRDVADRRDTDAAVCRVVDEVAALEALVLPALDPVVDRALEVLLGTGDDASLRVRKRVVLVHVDADAPDLRAARGAERPGPGEASDLEDHVHALVDHRLRGGLALVRRVEVLDVVHRHLDVGLFLLRGVLVALDVVHYRRDVGPAADHSDLVRLGDVRGDDAREIAGLRLDEDETLVVLGRGIGDELVHAEEVDGRVGLRLLQRVGADEEPNRHDEVVLLIDELLDVRGIVGRVLGDDHLRCWCADRLGAILRALPRVFVERLVLELTDVGDDADLRTAAGPGYHAAGRRDEHHESEDHRRAFGHNSPPAICPDCNVSAGL